MLPVSVGLGLINIDLVLNSMIGSLVSDEAPAAIDKAFRVYMLPQGMFSVAVATVVFPQLSRLAARRDLGADARRARHRHAPDRAAADPGRRGDHRARAPDRARCSTSAASSTPARPTSSRRRWPCSPSACRSSGWNLILTRTFFSLQQAVAADRAGARLAGRQRRRLAGAVRDRRRRRRARHRRLQRGADRAARATACAASWAGWSCRGCCARSRSCCSPQRRSRAPPGPPGAPLDDLLGNGLIGQIVALGTGLAVGGAVYAAIVLALRLPEARQILELLRGRLGRGSS